MKPHQYPIEFANLTQDQLNQIHAWLDEHSYKVTVQKLQAEFNIRITISKLARYNQRRELADDLTAESDYQLSVKELYDALNGAEAPYDKTAELLISKRIFQLLLSPDPIAPSKLALLHRLLTSRETRDFTERRLALAERRQTFLEEKRAAKITREKEHLARVEALALPAPEIMKKAAASPVPRKITNRKNSANSLPAARSIPAAKAPTQIHYPPSTEPHLNPPAVIPPSPATLETIQQFLEQHESTPPIQAAA